MSDAGPIAENRRPAWVPAPERVKQATITHFADWVEQGFGRRVTNSYQQLWRWSVDDVASFWSAIWTYFDVMATGPSEPALAQRSMPGAKWFPRARLNYAEHVFRDRDPNALALQFADERDPQPRGWTWSKLEEEAARVASGLRRMGIREGDRVAAIMPNGPEAVAAFLGCISLGAIWSAAPPEFGARAIIDRFAQIEPMAVLAVDGYWYKGTRFDLRDALLSIRAALPGVKEMVVLGQDGLDPLPDTVTWESFTSTADALCFHRVPFDHPLWILYSSGTTGLPKAIVHGHGGVLLEHLKTMHLHLDAHAHDRVFWFTTTGWMMWNFLVGVLLTGASIILYDGSPATPSLGVLWNLAEAAGATVFGASPAYFAACQNQDLRPGEGRDLTRLTAVGSTGSPLSQEGFRWIYDQLGPEMWLFSMSGGTDVCTAFVGGVPTLPVYLGELQAPALGTDLQVWGPHGRPLIGEVGELVITQPLPSMPLFFWGDGDGSRLVESYFSTFPGVWRHGDWAELTRRGTAIIHGRSDATVNRGGIRMGTSEIYRAVLALDDVVDALVVDVPKDGTDGWMPLFVVLREGLDLDPALAARIKRRVRDDCSPRHVPDDVYRVPEVPRTLSGKLLELPIKQILMGEAADDLLERHAIANPHSLNAFVHHRLPR